MGSRIDLQVFLETSFNTSNVYFQPPASVLLQYPAVVYSFEGFYTSKANDGNYRKFKRYSVTYIHRDADNSYTDKFVDVQYCNFDRRYIADNLYHDVFTLYD